MRIKSIFIALLLAGLPADARGQTLKERLRITIPNEQRVDSLMFSADGKTLYGGGRIYDPNRDPRETGVIYSWSTTTGKLLTTREVHKRSIYVLQLSPDGRRIASCSSDDVVKMWDARTWKELWSERAHNVYKAVAFSSDGTGLGVAPSHRGTVIIFDVENGKQLRAFRCKSHSYFAAFSPDLSVLALKNYEDVDLWSTRTGKLLRYLPDHRGRVEPCFFTSGGKTLVVIATEEVDYQVYRSEITHWDVATWKKKVTYRSPIDYPRIVLLSPDKKTVAITGAKTPSGHQELKLLDLETGMTTCTIASKDLARIIECVAFSRDGRTLATGLSNKTIKIWNVIPPKQDSE